MRDLTATEHEVAEELAKGLTHKEVAENLGMSKRTVDFHADNIRQKAGVNSTIKALLAHRYLEAR